MKILSSGSVMKNSKIDVVYVYKEVDDSEELKYSIRSVAKNWPHRKIWIVGDKPEWANDNIGIINPMGGFKAYSRYQDVNNKLRAVCKNHRVSDPFWFFNDDFFIMEEMDPAEFKTYYDGSLKQRHDDLKESFTALKTWPYLRGFEFAEKALKTNGCKSFKNYETHVPILFCKKEIKEVVNVFPKAVCRRSIYMNFFHPNEGVQHEDVKKYEYTDMVEIEDALLSTNNNSFKGNVGDYIKKMFKEKCEYER